MVNLGVGPLACGSTPQKDFPANATLVDAFLHRVDLHPEHTAFALLGNESDHNARLTFAGIADRAKSIAVELRSCQQPGDRTLIVCHAGLDFVSGFMACLLAGTVPTVIHPPSMGRLPAFHSRARSVLGDAEPTAILTTSALSEDVSGIPGGLGACPLLVIDGPRLGHASDWRHPGVTPDDIAFLQYTSGSTGDPKGIAITHANLADNIQVINKAFGLSAATNSVSWLPPHHDMGLVGQTLLPLWFGLSITLMSPMAFVQRPLRWLEAISRLKADTSGGPNFAYDLCVRRITPEQRDRLDLSSWKLAYVGAEPVRVETLRAFADYFAPCGFDAAALTPCYGLAESTLMVASMTRADPPCICSFDARNLATAGALVSESRELSASKLCSSGRPVQQVLIVDPETRSSCAPGRVGEIWVAGLSVAKGYWNRPVETAASLRAQLADGTGSFLRTGDLGFMIDGQLFVTGRIKDLIIVDGQNHYPQDLEQVAANAHEELYGNDCVAFSVPDERAEALVLVVGVTPGAVEIANEIRRAVRGAVAAAHDIVPRDIVLVRRGSIARTSSGKLRRHACRKAYLSSALDTIAP